MGVILAAGLSGCDKDTEWPHHRSSIFVQFTPGKTFKSSENIDIRSTHDISSTHLKDQLIYEFKLTPHAEKVVVWVSDKTGDATPVRVEIIYRSKLFLHSPQTYINRVYEIYEARSDTDQPIEVLHTELSALNPRPDVEVLL